MAEKAKDPVQIVKGMHLIADFPTVISEHIDNGGSEEEYEIEKGFAATYDHGDHTHYYIHVVATLPVEDYQSDLGFGLWVEVDQADFETFIEAQEDDEKYKHFKAKGHLANNWPLFPDTLGDEVEIAVVDVESKPQLVSIKASEVELNKYQKRDSLTEHQKDLLRERLIKLVEL